MSVVVEIARGALKIMLRACRKPCYPSFVRRGVSPPRSNSLLRYFYYYLVPFEVVVFGCKGLS